MLHGNFQSPVHGLNLGLRLGAGHRAVSHYIWLERCHSASGWSSGHSSRMWARSAFSASHILHFGVYRPGYIRGPIYKGSGRTSSHHKEGEIGIASVLLAGFSLGNNEGQGKLV